AACPRQALHSISDIDHARTDLLNFEANGGLWWNINNDPSRFDLDVGNVHAGPGPDIEPDSTGTGVDRLKVYRCIVGHVDVNFAGGDIDIGGNGLCRGCGQVGINHAGDSIQRQCSEG